MSDEKWKYTIFSSFFYHRNLHSKIAVIIIHESGVFELHIQKHLIAVTWKYED